MCLIFIRNLNFSNILWYLPHGHKPLSYFFISKCNKSVYGRSEYTYDHMVLASYIVIWSSMMSLDDIEWCLIKERHHLKLVLEFLADTFENLVTLARIYGKTDSTVSQNSSSLPFQLHLAIPSSHLYMSALENLGLKRLRGILLLLAYGEPVHFRKEAVLSSFGNKVSVRMVC